MCSVSMVVQILIFLAIHFDLQMSGLKGRVCEYARI